MSQQELTPKDMLKQAKESQQNQQEIKYKYDPEVFESIQYDPHYVNEGQKAWQSARSAWVRGIHYDSTIDDDWTSDVDHILVQLSKYQPFSEPVPLELMAELLEVVWLDAPNM